MKFVATSDWHLSSVKPVCRVDEDWVATQKSHLDKILSENLPVVIAGDVFDTPVVQPVITNMVIKFLSTVNYSIIAGNHDLPFHSVHKMNQCSFGAIRLLKDIEEGKYDFGTELPSDYNGIVVVHTYASDNGGIKGRDCKTSKELCNMFPNAKVIVVGDNHIPWTKRIGNQLVVNCGCLIQRTATESKGPCGYWIVDDEDLTATYVDCSGLSIGKIDTSYLDDIKDREAVKSDYEALIAEIKSNDEVKYDFESTLRDFINSNKISDGVKLQLENVLEYIKGE